MPGRHNPRPLSPTQQAYVRHFYPLGYGTYALAEAIFVRVERIRAFLRTTDIPRHAHGNNQEFRSLPPLTPLGTSRYRPPQVFTHIPTGDLDDWNRIRLPGWRIHDRALTR